MIKNISVVGLGKLGASMVAGFAEVGFNVIGYDILEKSVNALNNGDAPVEETDLDEYIKRNKSKISASSNLESVIHDSDITFVVVPTPSNEDGAYTSKPALSAFEDIGMP